MRSERRAFFWTDGTWLADARAAVERAAIELGQIVTHTDQWPTVAGERHDRAGTEDGIDRAATVDQRQLGMTFSPLGVVGTPTALSVHARLRRER
jgi:hypothetical protein